MRIKDEQIHPELLNTAIEFRKMATAEVTEEAMRATAVMYAQSRGVWDDPHISMEERYLVRPDGSTLRIAVFRRKGEVAHNATGVLMIHGGGYAMCVPENDALHIRLLLSQENTVVVAPDYICSTERPYPAALDDCYTALKWMKANAFELGIDRDQLFIIGNSAGGGLCAAVTLMARDKNEVAVAFQMPLYPMIDDRGDTESTRDNNAPYWDERSNRIAWDLYLRGIPDRKHTPVYAAPARNTDYTDFPPTVTFVGSIEPFLDETRSYVKALQKANVPVIYREFTGCFHGFNTTCPDTEVAKAANDFIKETFAYAKKHFWKKQPK